MKRFDPERQLRKVHRLRGRAEAAAASVQKAIQEEEVRIGRAAIAQDLAARRNKREERDGRTKRLIRLGGLVDLAGLLDLHADVLLGALAGASQFCQDEKWSRRWRSSGENVLRDAGAARKAATPEASKPRTTEEITLARKFANRKLIVAGGIVAKAGLSEASPEVVVGILKVIADHRNDRKRLEHWRVDGEAIRTKTLAEVEVEFSAPIRASASRSLSQLGLRFDRNRAVWMGLADPTLVSRVAKSENGMVSVDPRSDRKPGIVGGKKVRADQVPTRGESAKIRSERPGGRVQHKLPIED